MPGESFPLPLRFTPLQRKKLLFWQPARASASNLQQISIAIHPIPTCL
jgi:hypothetical protein